MEPISAKGYRRWIVVTSHPYPERQGRHVRSVGAAGTSPGLHPKSGLPDFGPL
jgi:hypothetical protein